MFKNGSYIVVLAQIPTVRNEQDGMIQREIAIDELIKDLPRVYLDKIFQNIPLRYRIKRWLRNHGITRKPPVRQLRDPLVRIFHYLTEKELYLILKDSACIYVHSLYKLKDIPTRYLDEFKDKMVLDIHGCVVEENIFTKESQSKIATFQRLEEDAFPKLCRLVAVSHSMVEFYKNKYPKSTTEFIVLPIFTKIFRRNQRKSVHKKLTIVYSGGLQRYQNIDLMLDSIARVYQNFNFKIFTAKKELFKHKLKIAGIPKIPVRRVPSYRMPDEYISCDLGYILRDDMVVNTVACPTKLVEYLTYGIVPIVLSPRIGDFDELSYSYVLNSKLVEGYVPSWEELQNMRTNNFSVMDRLYGIEKKGKVELRKLLESFLSTEFKH